MPSRRISRVVPEVVIPITISPTKEVDEEHDEDEDMDIEEEHVADRDADVNSLLAGEQEVEEMVGVEDEEEEETAKVSEAKPARIWPDVSTDRAERYRREVRKIRDSFEEEVDMEDTTMVSEYAEEIYDYMCELEVCRAPTNFLASS